MLSKSFVKNICKNPKNGTFRRGTEIIRANQCPDLIEKRGKYYCKRGISSYPPPNRPYTRMKKAERKKLKQ